MKITKISSYKNIRFINKLPFKGSLSNNVSCDSFQKSINTETQTNHFTLGDISSSRQFKLAKENKGNLAESSLQYQIKDKSKVILNVKRQWHKVDDNNTITTINGEKYNAHFDDSDMQITVFKNGKITIINIKDKLDTESTLLNGFWPYSEDKAKEFYSTCKLMPADLLLDLDKYTDKIYITDEFDSGVFLKKKAACLPPKICITAHEMGHFIANDLSIKQNPELKETYNREYEHFIQNSSLDEQDILKHFSKKNNEDSEGLEELVAEANVLLKSNIIDSEDIQKRDRCLLKYFPKSISIASQHLN